MGAGGVNVATLRADALAALLAAVLVLPQGIAFATLAGLPAAWGLYSAVVPTLIAVLAGSSRHVLTGLTNALSLALAASLAPLAAAGSAEYLRLALVVVTLLIGLIQVAVALLWLGVLRHFVAPSVLLGFTSGAAALIGWHALVDLGVWPQPDLPALAVGALTLALALTIVALGQTVAISKALAQRSGQALDVNRECLGQGLANMVGAFFSCFASCGSLNRSVPHLQAGARTPLAGVFAALLLVALVALAAPLLAWIPQAAISGLLLLLLLLLVAVLLVDRTAWRELLRLDRREAAVAAGTLLATLLLPLQVAVLAGVAASLVLYLQRTAHPALRTMGFALPPAPGVHRPFVVLEPGAPECPQLKPLRMEASVWFGAEAQLDDALQALHDAPTPAHHLLVMGKSMNFIDAAGASLWELERQRRLASGGDLYFHRPQPEVLRVWQASGYTARLGADHVFADKRSAIAAIVPQLDGGTFASCWLRVFEECAHQPGGVATETSAVTVAATVTAAVAESPPAPTAPPLP